MTDWMDIDILPLQTHKLPTHTIINDQNTHGNVPPISQHQSINHLPFCPPTSSISFNLFWSSACAICTDEGVPVMEILRFDVPGTKSPFPDTCSLAPLCCCIICRVAPCFPIVNPIRLSATSRCTVTVLWAMEWGDGMARGWNREGFAAAEGEGKERKEKESDDDYTGNDLPCCWSVVCACLCCGWIHAIQTPNNPNMELINSSSQ